VNLDIHEDIRKAHTPPSRFYTDPEALDLTKEKVFARSWQWVGDVDMVKVPGQVHPFTLLEGCLDEPCVFTRDTDDDIHCVSNVCTHRGNLVVEGPGNERFLRCRYHGKRFGLDGCFQHMPEFEECEGFPSESDSLPKVPFGKWKQFLFAGVRPAHPLADILADMDRRIGWLPIEQAVMESARVRDYMIRGHWALYVENYLEGFHIPFIHADLNSVLEYDQYATELFRHSNLQLGVSSGGEEVFDLPSSSPDFGKQVSAYYWWVFPNLMFNFYPWGLSINVVKPLGPDRTRVSFIGYAWDRSKMERGAGGALDRVEREDEAVVEMVQQGIRSRFYDRGRYSPKRETGTHHFHRLLQEYIG
jgi:choline monooxygenase